MPAKFEFTDDSRRRSKMYIGAGILVALVAAASVYLVIRQAGMAGENQAAKREVVVAVRDIAARKPIEEGDVIVRSVIADATNESAYSRIDQVLNRVSGVTIQAGQLITRNVLASATEGQAFSILEPGASFDPNGPDWRAVSVNVPDDRAVAGLLQPGQRVDLIVTMPVNPELGPTPGPSATPPEPVIAGPSTKVTLQALTILGRNGPMYILRADLTTAEQIAELQAAGGQFALALRADEDGRTATTLGSTIDMLFEQFGFPVPRPPDLGKVSPTPTPAP